MLGIGVAPLEVRILRRALLDILPAYRLVGPAQAAGDILPRGQHDGTHRVARLRADAALADGHGGIALGALRCARRPQLLQPVQPEGAVGRDGLEGRALYGRAHHGLGIVGCDAHLEALAVRRAQRLGVEGLSEIGQHGRHHGRGGNRQFGAVRFPRDGLRCGHIAAPGKEANHVPDSIEGDDAGTAEHDHGNDGDDPRRGFVLLLGRRARRTITHDVRLTDSRSVRTSAAAPAGCRGPGCAWPSCAGRLAARRGRPTW